jgi:phage shock protein PspC (stress-responsive transcriptional regulator)
MTENDTGYAANDTGYAPPPPGFTPPPPPPAARPGLRRATGDGAVLGGVAAGIARSLRVDPVLVRVAFVVLTIFGGSGLLLYVAGWLFIPEEGRDDSTGERFFRNNNALVITLAVIVAVLIVGPMLAWGWMGDGAGAGGAVLVVLVIVGIVLLLRRDEHAPTGSGGVQPQLAPDAGPPAGGDSPTPPPSATSTPTMVLPAGSVAPPVPPVATPAASGVPPVPPPPKERSVLGRLTVGVALLVAGTLIALDVADVIVVEPVVVLASALAVVALGLLVGTLLGRARGLIALGIVLTFLLIPVGAAPDGLRVEGGAGERLYRPTSQSELLEQYQLGVGELTVDLRRLDVVGTEDVEISVGMGEVIVLLPPDVAIDVDADVGAGTIDLPAGGPEQGGIGVEQSWQRDGDGTGTVNLTISAGLGAVTVIDDRPLAGGKLVTP